MTFFASRFVGQAGMWGAAAEVLSGTVATGLTAAGADHTDGFAITEPVSVFGTVASGTGAVLPANLSRGDTAEVYNLGANALLVYPPLGGTINGAAANAGVSVAAGKAAVLRCVSTNGKTWVALVGA